MPVPPLNRQGVLPERIHDCTLDEIRDVFVQRGSTSQRRRLFEDLEKYIRELRSASIAETVIVNGSFVTSKRDPNDIDLIVVQPADFDLAQRLRPFEYNLISHKRVKRNYGLDILVVLADSDEYHNIVEVFHGTRDPTLRKGLARVIL